MVLKLTVVLIDKYYWYQICTKLSSLEVNSMYIVMRYSRNTSNNLWVADFMLGLLDISSGGICNQLLQSQSYCNPTALIIHRLIPCILLPLLFTSLITSYWLVLISWPYSAPQLFCIALLYCCHSLYNRRTDHRKHLRLRCWHMFKEALLRNGSHSFYCYNYSVARCLSSRCLAMLWANPLQYKQNEWESLVWVLT
jgi:hypothetical protein